MHVFEAAYKHDFPHCRLHSGLVTDSPVVVSQVSRQWRRVVMCSTSLWSCLHITMEQSPAYVEALEAFIERSGDRPLSVMFICHSKEWEVAWDSAEFNWPEFERLRWSQFEKCWQILLEQRARIRHLAMYACQDESIAHLHNSLQHSSFTQLEYLHMQGYYMLDTKDLDGLSIDAPKLTQLRIHTLPIVSSPRLYNRLTALELDRIEELNDTDILQALALAAPTLHTLVLRTAHFDHRNAEDRALLTISFPRLRSLYLYNVLGVCAVSEDRSRQTAMRKLFSDVPSLRTLHSYESIPFIADLCMVPFPFHSVRSFTCVTTKRHASWTWGSFIHSFHALEDLQIIDYDALGLLRLLVQLDSDASQRIWPDLRALTLRVCDDEGVASLLDFLSHRSRVKTPIGTLTVYIPDAPEPVRERLRCALRGVADLDVHWSVAHYASDPPNPWDSEKDRPRFVPWNDSLTFYDQY